MWTGAQFASRHNHGLQPAQASHAARIANAVLRSGAPEGESIAIANKWAQRHHRDAGGSLQTAPAVGGMVPSVSSVAPGMSAANPMTRSLMQRYAAIPTEKLQEMKAMMGNSPYGQIINSVLQQRLSQPTAFQAQPQIQQPMAMAAAQPQQQARGGVTRLAIGGGSPLGVPMSMADPWWTRQEAYGADRGGGSGFLAGATSGRADQIETTAPGGAYIIPADVISGMGEGNSLAGARVVDEMLRSGPHGTEMPHGRMGRGPPRPPSDPQLARASGIAKGGGVQSGQGEVPVALSHGEYSVSPEHVAMIGGGDHKRGIRILDKWVVEMRKRHIAELKELKPPVGSRQNTKKAA